MVQNQTYRRKERTHSRRHWHAKGTHSNEYTQTVHHVRKNISREVKGVQWMLPSYRLVGWESCCEAGGGPSTQHCPSINNHRRLGTNHHVSQPAPFAVLEWGR